MNNRIIKELVITAAKAIVRLCTHVFWVFPIKMNRVYFQSYEQARSYSCNPKYISEKLEKEGTLELVWAFSRPADYKDFKIRGITTVKYLSLKWFYYVLTARVVVINVIPRSFIAKRPGQFVICTGHSGGAYKRIGYAKNTASLANYWTLRMAKQSIDLFVSSSKAYTESNIKSYHYTGRVLNCGMPRNDVFFDEKRKESIRNATREQLGLSGMVILYAPTYRGHIYGADSIGFGLPTERILKSKNGKGVKILLRQHHHDNTDYSESLNQNVINVSNYPDMQELLLASDILITDYSSSIWDYALLEKPCILYVPDLIEYETKDGGFFTPIDQWPGIVCSTEDELISTINRIEEYPYKAIAKKHLNEFQSYENGTACLSVARVILEECRRKKE